MEIYFPKISEHAPLKFFKVKENEHHIATGYATESNGETERSVTLSGNQFSTSKMF